MDELTLTCQERMEKCIVSLKESFNTLRTGRANASLLDKIECDYYGEKMPINQICAITIPEPRQILVKPYDKGDIKSVYNAIAGSDLYLNPINDGDSIRIVIPPLTEDKRKELAKKAKSFAEESKVAIRNIRREFFDKLKKSDDYSDDLKDRIEKEMQKVTDEIIVKVDNLTKEKEKEILSI